MSSLLSCSALEKSFGSRPLFQGITLSIGEGERVGMLGPNGAGKSTLLKIFAGLDTPDDGKLNRRKGVRLAYLAQDDRLPADSTVGEYLEQALMNEPLAPEERHARVGEVRSIVGFPDLDMRIGTLSGGWRKRAALAAQLVLHPDLLLLDEPTNHLDLEGIRWLEKFVDDAECAIVIISHDRALLENVTNRIVEINRIYPQGFFSVDGNYSRFLEKRAEYLEGLARYEEGLRNKVRREIEWLRQGAKARTTKSRGRIQQAEKLIDELKGYEARSAAQGSAGIDFLASGRKTKKLLELVEVSKSLGGRELFKDIEFVLSPGVRVGVVGANGSGKSTLLNVLSGTLEPDRGRVVRAPRLRLVKFEQDRSSLDPDLSLKRILAPDGDSVIYRGESLHVAAWAKRFLFRSEQLEAPVRSLSGGEQARLLIARLMLSPADVLLLDEPTNDLDIDTLQVLEESLEEFEGAVVLVTHDRFMLDRVSTTVLGLDGTGAGTFFASYGQWEEFLQSGKGEKKSRPTSKSEPLEAPAADTKKKLSYHEQRELLGLEQKTAGLEAQTAQIKEQLMDPAIAQDAKRLNELCAELATKQEELERLLERWIELDERR
ncbi:MAG: ABC-F family ATP-binding cassette domain-containing protein [Bdellovibrionota bacterium]